MLISRRAVVLTTLALPLMLIACARPENTDAVSGNKQQTTVVESAEDRWPRNDPGELAGTEWALTSLRGREPIGGNYGAVTLDFDKDAARGSAGCNAYGMDVVASDGSLNFSRGEMTEVGCGRALGQQEREYLDTLDNAAGYRIVDDRLEIRNQAGETTLIFAQRAQFRSNPRRLAGTGWMVHTVNGKPLDESAAVPSLSFDSDKKFSGYDGCQHFRGEYSASASALSFPDIGMVEADCMKPDSTPKTMGSTGGYPPGEDYRITGRRLEISSPKETVVYVPHREGVNTGRTEAAWEFDRFVEGNETTPVLRGTEITLIFDEGTLRRSGKVSGSAGCNAYDASYEYPAAHNTLEHLKFGTPSTARRICSTPARIMEQERRYLDILADLGKHPSVTVDGRMRLETRDGQTLEFSAPE